MTTYHHGTLRATLLGAAAKMIEREGLAGLSLREAARRAGVSHAAPYRHFADREALLAALAAEGFAELGRVLEGKSGRSLGEAYVQFALQHPQRFRLMFTLSRPEHARGIREQLAAAFAGFGAEAGFAAWSVVHGLALLLLDGHVENQPGRVKSVLGAMRFAVGAQRSA